MKNKVIYFVIIGLFSIIQCYALSQSKQFRRGYIVSFSSDTTFGYIQESEINSICSYFYFKKDSLIEKIETYYPNEIKFFYYETNNFFISRRITIDNHDQFKFFKILISANTSLYQSSHENKIIYLLEKKGKDTVLLSKKDNTMVYKTNADGSEGSAGIKEDIRYRSYLKYLLSDCSELKNDLNNVGFYEEDIIKIIEKYNKCLNPDSVIKHYSTPTIIKFHYSTVIGSHSTLMTFYGEPFNNAHLNNKFGIDAGVGFGLSYLSFYLQLNLIYSQYHSKYSGELFPNSGDIENLDFSFSYIIIPVSFRYYLLNNKKIMPYFFLGGQLGYLIYKNVNWKSTFASRNNDNYPIDLTYNNKGYLIGVGLTIPFIYIKPISVELGYSSSDANYNNSVNAALNLSNFYCSLIFNFK